MKRVPYGSQENYNLLQEGRLRCTKCCNIYDIANFYKCRGYLTGYKSVCKPCANIISKKYRENHQKKHRSNLVVVMDSLDCKKCKKILPTAQFTRDASNHRGFAFQCKKCVKTRPHRQLEYQNWQAKKKMYGVTKDHFYKMLSEQKGVCLICKKTPKRFVIDHNHTTKKVRGLLCNNCNSGIGYLGDSISMLRNAAIYLEEKDGS